MQSSIEIVVDGIDEGVLNPYSIGTPNMLEPRVGQGPDRLQCDRTHSPRAAVSCLKPQLTLPTVL